MTDMKKGWIWCMALCLCIVICSAAAGAEPVPEYDKILQIQLKVQDGKYSVSSLEVKYGKAPNLGIKSGVLAGKILDTGGKELQSFSVQEPGRGYGDILGNPEGDTLIGYTEDPAYTGMYITAPYQQGMKQFALTDSRDGTRLVTADLEPAVTAFCIDYPGDPDCLARTAPVKTATPQANPVTSNLYLILAAVLSVSVAVAAGIAILTIRRKSAGIPIPEEVAKAPEKQTILIVDDEPDIVKLIDIFLVNKGYATLKAFSGRGCLDTLARQIPDLILLDVRMDPMDGWQTLEQIKKKPEYKQIPVLMLTGKRLTAAEARQYNICIDDYIMKPFGQEDLLTAIGNVLARKQQFKENLALARKAGVDKEKFCELAKLSRRISVNKKIVDILQGPEGIPMLADLGDEEDKAVIKQITVTTSANEKRVEQLRKEINSAFRSKGFPEINW